MSTSPRIRKSPRLKVLTKIDGDFKDWAERLRAFADPDRLRIVKCLLDGPKNVSELAAELDVGIVKVSHHLRVLRNADVVETEKQGKFVVYSLHPDVAACGVNGSGGRIFDFGCCQIDVTKPKLG